MVRHLATFGLWLALLFVADQLFTWAFNSVQVVELNTGPDVARLDDVTPELVLLFVNVLVFASAGALLAWRIDYTWLSALCGAGLGCA